MDLNPRRGILITGIQVPAGWEVAPDGLLSLDGQSCFQVYGDDGGLCEERATYYQRFNGIECHALYD